MVKKLTYEKVKELFTSEGYTLLSKTYDNYEQKLEYICPLGHRHAAKLGNFRHGKRCPLCSGIHKVTGVEVKLAFDKEGYKITTLMPDGHWRSTSPIKYLCSQEHETSITWKRFKRGDRCAQCKGVAKHSYDYIKQEFAQRAYDLVSKEYVNAYSRLDYICSKGHETSISYTSFQRGNGCRRCYLERRKGEGAPNWNPRLTIEDRIKSRAYPEYRQWREAVFERDGYTCRACGASRTYLNAHHLDSYARNPEARLLLSNGVTLCQSCHSSFHHKFGRYNNTRVQFQWFMLQNFGTTLNEGTL